MIAFSILHLYLLTRPVTQQLPKAGAFGGGKDFRGALETSPVSVVVFLLSLAALGPIMTLFVYHLRLIVHNRSTVEQIRINTAKEYGESPADAGGARQLVCLPCIGRDGRGRDDPHPFSYGNCLRNTIAVLGRPTNDSWIARYTPHREDQRAPNPVWNGGAAPKSARSSQLHLDQEFGVQPKPSGNLSAHRQTDIEMQQR